MTIFVNIGKLFLARAIKEAIDHSANADSSNTNAVLTLFHCPRDLELGKAKRLQLSALITELNALPTRSNDEISLHQFQALLTQHKTRLAQLAQEKQLSEGETGKALLQALELIQSIYTQMQVLQLLNIPKINDALIFFQYYAAHYFAIKISTNQRLNIVQNITEQPYVSVSRERAQARAILITQALTQCMNDLDALDKKNPNHRAAVIRQVTLNIEALLRNERSLHDRYGAALDATISLFNLISVTQQDNDLLNQCMQEALKGIRELSRPKTDSQLTDWCNAGDEYLFAEEARQKMETDNGLNRGKIEALENLSRNALEKEETAAATILLDAFRNEAGTNQQEVDEEDAYEDEDETNSEQGWRNVQ
jgi:hypothetical protein